MLPNSSIINKLLYLLVVQLIPICATAQSSGMNYIQTKTFLDEDGLTFLRHRDCGCWRQHYTDSNLNQN